jgi:hypothetical protein
LQVSSTSNTETKSPKEQKPKTGSLKNGAAKRSQSEEKPKAKQSLENKLNEKSQNRKRSLPAGKNASKKDGTPVKKAKKRLLVDGDASGSNDKLVKVTKSSAADDDDDDDDIVLAVLKKTAKKKKRPEKGSVSDMPLSELQNRKTPSSDSSDEDDIALAALKPKKSPSAVKKEKNTGKTSKSSPSKMKVSFAIYSIKLHFFIWKEFCCGNDPKTGC